MGGFVGRDDGEEGEEGEKEEEEGEEDGEREMGEGEADHEEEVKKRKEMTFLTFSDDDVIISDRKSR